MKHTIKRALALFIALLLAMPSFAFAEAPGDQLIVIENVSDAADQELSIESLDIEPLVEEADAILPGDPDGTVDQELDIGEGLTLDLGELLWDEPNAAASSPFDQTVTVGNATFTVTAGAGVFPDGAKLRVKAEESDEVARGVAASLGTEGVYTHRLYRVEVLDADDHVILPNAGQGTPALRVEGLNLPEDARVVMYDEAQGQLFDIDAIIKADENAIEFSLHDMTVYDILSIAPSPVEEEPAEAPADQKPSPANEVSDSGEGAEQSEADEVAPLTDTTPTTDAQQDATSPDTADAVPPSPEGEGSEDADQSLPLQGVRAPGNLSSGQIPARTGRQTPGKVPSRARRMRSFPLPIPPQPRARANPPSSPRRVKKKLSSRSAWYLMPCPRRLW